MVAILPIISNICLVNEPGNVLTAPNQSGLLRDSVINVSEILTVDRTALLERTGTLPARQMEQI